MKRTLLFLCCMAATLSVVAQSNNTPIGDVKMLQPTTVDGKAASIAQHDIDSTRFRPGQREIITFNVPQIMNVQSPIHGFHQYDFSANGTIGQWGGLNFVGTSSYQEQLNLMIAQSASIGIDKQANNLAFALYFMAMKYNTVQGITNQFGVGGQLRYALSDRVSVTAFAQYYNLNPYFSMAAFPYVGTSRYGGYFSIEGERVGIDLGVQQHYDPFARRMVMTPIVTPKIRVSRSVTIGVSVGQFVKDGVDRLINGDRQQGPTIMPQRR